MELPRDYQERMRALLGEEYGDYLRSLSGTAAQGIRVNTGKISVEKFLALAPFELRPVPWTENGFYVEDGARVTRHPYYYAGLYYVQEPSAMLPAALLAVEKGDRVLDLCAAPGGKATELGSRLAGMGLLAANDISTSRARALLKNLELSGTGNMIVCSEPPERLLAGFRAYFDRILVDAPCSGEGMFRKDASVIKNYGLRGPEYYAKLQTKILDAAVQMLRPGGRLVYSTCTFSAAENEEVLLSILKKYPQMCLEPVSSVEGAASLPELPGCVRLYPHRVRGEGHFAAVLRRMDGAPEAARTDAVRGTAPEDTACGKLFAGAAAGKTSAVTPQEVQIWLDFAEKYLSRDFPGWELFAVQERLYALPAGVQRMPGLRCLRTGLYLGDCGRHGFEPSQALALFLQREDVQSAVSFPADDARVFRYLKGETVELSDQESKGLFSWTLVCVDRFPLGWAKWVNGSLRNKYNAAWRMN